MLQCQQIDNSAKGLAVRRVVVEGSITQEYAMTSLLIVRSAKLLPLFSIIANQSVKSSHFRINRLKAIDWALVLAFLTPLPH